MSTKSLKNKVIYFFIGVFFSLLLTNILSVIMPPKEPSTSSVSQVSLDTPRILASVGLNIPPKNSTHPTHTPSISDSDIQIPFSDNSHVASTTYAVTSVIDGDTIKIDMDGRSETLRLIGIDTPETVDPRKPVQCFGMEASKRAKELLSGRRVFIEKDDTQGDRDKYGRLLVYVFRDDGVFFNELMIQEGYAHEYTYSLPYKYQKIFRADEQKARNEGRGLWEKGVCEDFHSQSASPSAPETESVITGGYDCSKNVYDCSDFSSQKESQQVFQFCGGRDRDIHHLDSDHDGIVCESLQK